MNPDLKLVFSYKGKEYPVFIPEDRTLFRDEELMDGQWSIFWWDEGNGGCDCNRSCEIAKHFSDFPVLGCGHQIELSDYEIIEKDEK